MKKILFLPVFVFLNCKIVPAREMKTSGFYAGAATAKINPAQGTYLAGYDQNRKSTGIHDDLFAHAVVISNGREAVSIVTLDCIGLPYPVVEKIRQRVKENIPDPSFHADQVVVTSTHTHSGADVIGIWGEDMLHTGVDAAYMQLVIHAAAGAVAEAWKNKQPATARYAQTYFGEGWVENISDSSEIDRQVTILQFINTKKENIASLVNFACHPTFLPNENTLTSSDFPSGFYKQLNEKLGGVNLYVQGAIGGWVQPEKVARNFEDAEQKGKALADAVLGALKKTTPLSANRIKFAARRFEMPVSNTNFRDLAAAGVIKRNIENGKTLTEIAWFSIGEACFATHPGESSPKYSIDTRNMMKTKGPKFILGLGMDELGYIIKPEFFEPGTTLYAVKYLTSMSPGKDAGPAMMQVLAELAENDQ